MQAIQPSSGHQPATSVQMLHAFMRFGRVARYRWPLVAGALVAVCLLGVLYFATVERIYAARAQLLVQQTGPVVTANGTTEGHSQQGMLPTYERLFTSTVVLEGAIQRLLDQPRELRVDLLHVPREGWVGVLREGISVRSLRLTNVIEIGYRSRSPEAAEAVVVALVDSYMQFMKSNHETVAEELGTILRQERLDVEKALREKEQQLVQAKRQFGDIGLRDASQTLHPLVQRVVRVNENLIAVQQNRLKLQATLASVENAVRAGTDLKEHLYAIEPIVGRETVLASLGLSDQDGETVAQLEQRLVADQAELQSLQSHLGARHPQVLQLMESIRQTRSYLSNYQQSVNRRAERLRTPQFGQNLIQLIAQELQKTAAEEDALKQQYAHCQTEAVQLHGRFEEIAMLQREVDRLLNLNHTLLDHIDSIDINQNQTDVRVEIVSRPQAGKTPVAPNAILVLATCLFGGTLLGAAIVYVVDVLDDRFRSLEEMKLQLQTPILTLVRHLLMHKETGIESLQMYVAPDAVESEAFRTLRTTLAFAGEELECVAVSSSEPGDGKTTIVGNLGVSFAQTGRRTLLIDADLRRPGLTRMFEMKGRSGLSEILRGQENVGALVAHGLYATEQHGLDVIPSGARPLDPTGLLTSPRFADLLAWAGSHYDQVVIDSPPMLVASDAAVVGRLAGGLMLVVQPQKNHRRLVVRAIEEARAVGLNLIGVIVNRLTNEGAQAYYSDSYGYGYGYGYGAPYGETAEEDDTVRETKASVDRGEPVAVAEDVAPEPVILPFRPNSLEQKPVNVGGAEVPPRIRRSA